MLVFIYLFFTVDSEHNILFYKREKETRSAHCTPLSSLCLKDVGSLSFLGPPSGTANTGFPVFQTDWRRTSCQVVLCTHPCVPSPPKKLILELKESLENRGSKANKYFCLSDFLPPPLPLETVAAGINLSVHIQSRRSHNQEGRLWVMGKNVLTFKCLRVYICLHLLRRILYCLLVFTSLS